MTNNQSEQALLLRQLHDGRQILALPNAWDVASACLIEAAGAKAIATTSAGVAWSLGAADGDQLDRDRALDLIARVVAAVDVPVTADIESGYATDPAGVAETIRGVLAAGAVGVNLEDGPFLSRPVEEQTQRIAAARQAADTVGVPMFLNARIDTYLRQYGDPADRFAATVERAAAYLAAGADGIFLPGVVDQETISVLVKAIPAPVNVLAGPGAPTVDVLAELGVARVSLGAGIASAAYALARRSAEELLATGSYSTLADTVDYGDLNALVGGRP
ncbi:isocitrate lyase/phosphoenolpyruvate mutase family protein [Micromonospora polyrhachis]|uniref:2-methylisocitrate lyase-like PEP mutase family enzyme n=1 Tax=Micromonospora polyrhachis TaxID=1282883 RepID=A0A7W7SSK5_9ACTN|nr:isocitrate lyase/phosphoenolpyruvate mutase family protein [Micromonospora polyrhachis]MBB4960189.1 2-methylisocitrate lyase-like PEP mutase family enzyme [Micromonospora polyrhachis]